MWWNFLIWGSGLGFRGSMPFANNVQFYEKSCILMRTETAAFPGFPKGALDPLKVKKS